MHSSALDGAGKQGMAHLQHDTEIQPPISTPCQASDGEEPSPTRQSSVHCPQNPSQRHISTPRSFRCTCRATARAVFIPWSSIRRHSTRCLPEKYHKWRTMEHGPSSYVLLDSGHGRKILIPGRKGEHRCIAYLEHSAGRALLHSLLAVTVQCYGHGNSQIE
jgi:hypothetical protein